MTFRPSPSRLLALSLVAPSAALAQPASPSTLDPIVVTATRVQQPLTDVLADVTLIDRAAIERSGATGLADLLVRQPGIAMSRNGGPAGTTSLFVRGAENRFTPVFIDGVRVDSQATGGFSWSAIPLSQIDRIEIVRGPAAAVYGSDAMAGVVQIFTRRGEGPPTPTVLVGIGSNDTRRAEASVRGRSGAIDYSLGLAGERSDGFDSQVTGNPDEDGYRRRSASGSLGWRLDDAHRVELTALASRLDAQFDGFMPGFDDHALQHLRTLGAAWSARWSDRYSTRLALSRGTERYETTPSPYVTETRVTSYLLQNEWRLGAHRFNIDLERREDRLDNASTSPAVTDRFQNALALGWGLRQGAHTVQLNARHDDDSEFGGQSTGSLAYGFEFRPDWRITASAGTAFRAPTLFQRFSIYGLPTLRPERAQNREIGLRYASAGTSFSAVAYRSRVRELINFLSGPGNCPPTASAFGCYANTGQAELEGLTLAAGHRLGSVNLSASFDLQDPRDLATGNQLPRRARRFATLAADTRVAGWTTGAELQLVDDRFNNAANTQRLPGYGLLNLHASTAIGRDWRLLARIDNVAGKDWQTALGYRMPGRMAQVALQWEPK
ncbi:TonB-dependent receptor [Ramlibacter sp. AW1]|uniref:TonB-dependent receptor n=1 Tax=Ramlibacter aurantiacus TaxID=2801330 RepID=A0A936ZKH6_9BURK|nr:TonB-dependent receptor [Ramlibacter aurantiacus]MBL0418885.1 TonB-dependent receptor [Ramlibacter aurantiacus]